MSKVIKLKKGLDIKLNGEAEKVLSSAAQSSLYGVSPANFVGLTPKLLVKAGDRVKAGTAIMFDKYRPELLFSSPVSGTVKEIVRGEKRKILDIVIEADSQIEYEKFEVAPVKSLTVEAIKELMLKSGLWPMMIQRPYGTIASEGDTPRAIYVSMFDSAPLAPDTDMFLSHYKSDLELGLEVLKKLSGDKLFAGMSTQSNSALVNTVSKFATINTFSTMHPAGCVGVQIANSAPISKGEIIWTIDPQSILILGRFFRDGVVNMEKLVAVAGSEVEKPRYHKIIFGAKISSFCPESEIKAQANGAKVRVIDGNVLTGTTSSFDNYFGFYKNVLTVIPEGDNHEFFGWLMPRLHKFSVSRSYFSWLMPSKSYSLDTNQNGGHRAFVMTGEYEKVLPMDIYPVYLLKAILAGDIDKMENLGIYEVIEEDMALCEFVCTSKIDVQKILRDGINTMIKELN